MIKEDFDKLLEKRLKATVDVLSSKNKEYASATDKLHNFKRAGAMLGCTPERALVGMWTKHIISILDMVDKIEKDSRKVGFLTAIITWNSRRKTIKLLEEKIGDAINYLILLEALIKERYKT